MNLFQRRRLKKEVKQLLHDARHACHMREDIAAQAELDAVHEAEARLKAVFGERDYPAIEAAGEELVKRTQKLYPPKPRPRTREYIEILVVAISVAMAFRTFFVQPFKIPTGSMEPTLYGIKVEAQVGRGVMDHFPLNLVSLALFGERYKEVKAARSGVVDQLVRDDTYVFSLNGVVPPFRPGMAQQFELGDYITKGQVLASGRVRSGDHIFVNKVRYNFSRPERGDVFVFNTDDVAHPQVKVDTYYIKRLVGLPGETIALDPPYLVVDGERVTEPAVFDRQAHARDLGYRGYVYPSRNREMPAPLLLHRRSRIQLAENEYLPFGDNTLQSLDGRYFGGVNQDNIVGPATLIYWPFSSRWGFIR